LTGKCEVIEGTSEGKARRGKGHAEWENKVGGMG